MSLAARDRLVPVLLSAALHAGLAGLFIYGWWQWRENRPPPAPTTLAIEATLVSAAPAPVAAQSPAPIVPKPPDPAVLQRQQAAEAKAAAAAEAARRQADADAAAEARAAAKAKVEAERVATERRKREAAAAQRQAEEQRRADDLRRSQLEAELRARLASEERQTAARSATAQAAYVALIRQRVERAWKRPPTARSGLSCEVRVTQVPGGVVTGVQIGSCNGDDAVRSSIETAVYAASPLPEPEIAELFDRNLVFNFRPND